MNRLREETGSDPTRARGVKLLRSMGPRENVPEMKQRVWLAVQRGRRLMQQTSWSDRPLLLRRKPVFLAGLLLLSAATAGAMIGRRVVEQQRSAAMVAPKSPSFESTHPTRRPSSVALVAPPSARIEQPPPARRAETRGPSPRGPVQVQAKVKERTLSRRASIPPMTDRSAQSGNQLLLDAMVALRRERDSQRAGELLERFLTEFPRGALREEALALSVEAALARNDGPGRDRWARAYLQAYPSGRFKDFVEGSLSGP